MGQPSRLAWEVAKTALWEARCSTVDLLRGTEKVSLGAGQEAHLEALRRDGYVVVPGFWSSDECAAAREAIDASLVEHRERIWADDVDSDTRLYFAERADPRIASFWKDPRFFDVLAAHQKSRRCAGFVLANRLVSRPGNLGSGGGWHRDLSKRDQVKAILYLSDVTLETGPFQYLRGSHTLPAILRSQLALHAPFGALRYTDEELERLERSGHQINTFVAPAGTLLLVDTRGIHRGKPILRGERYALTNYYWFQGGIPSHFRKLGLGELRETYSMTPSAA